MNYFKRWYFAWKALAFIAGLVFMYAIAQLGGWAITATIAALFFWALDHLGEFCWKEYLALKPLYETGILKQRDGDKHA